MYNFKQQTNYLTTYKVCHILAMIPGSTTHTRFITVIVTAAVAVVLVVVVVVVVIVSGVWAFHFPPKFQERN